MLAVRIPIENDLAWWMASAYAYGAGCLCLTLQQLKRGELAINPAAAWENTMAGLEFVAQALADGRAQIAFDVTKETVELVQRLRLLGSEALSGGQPSPEMLPLTERCLVAFYGPDWASSITDLGYGFPPV